MDVTKAIELTVGSEHVVSMTGGAGGFQWSVTVADPTVVDVSRISRDRGLPSDRPGDTPDSQFLIIATNVGVTRLEFRLARPWRPQDSVEQRYFVVTVT